MISQIAIIAAVEYSGFSLLRYGVDHAHLVVGWVLSRRGWVKR